MGEEVLTHPGTIFACTDGLTDVVNNDNEYFDDDHIEAIIEEAGQSGSAEELNNKLIEAVDIFKGAKPYPDDIAVLTCKYTIN